MYAVFEKCVQTDVGQDIVREHTTDSDAQAVYQKLCKHALRSTKASLSSQSLLTYITSVRLGDGKWKGTYHSFLVNWKNQIRLYENMVSGKSRFSDEQKMIMLQNAVHPIEDLRAVKNTADQFKAQTGSEIDYHAYYRLLVSAAQQLDGTSTPAPRGVPRRHVYQHETLVHGEGFEAADGDVFYDAPHDIEPAYNIDSDVQFMEVYASHSGTPRPMLPSHQWQKLAHEDKKVWSQLSDAGKRVLLGNTGSGTATKPPPGPWQSARPPNSGFIKSNPSSAGSARKLNLHEISVADFISDQLSTLHNDASTIGDTTQATSSGETDNDLLLAHLTKRKTLPPHDLRRILSPSMSKDGSNQNPKKAPREVQFQGTTYREVSMANIVYKTSEHRHVRKGALVDRGANGGLAGDDMRILFGVGKQVDVQGIDNHQLIDIPLVTAAGLTHSQRGPVILIFNQFASIGKGKSILSSGQMEHFGVHVDDKAIAVGGTQCITTPEGFKIPLNIKAGLPYMDMRIPTDAEMKDPSIPNLIMTSDNPWDPSVLDLDLTADEEWFETTPDPIEDDVLL